MSKRTEFGKTLRLRWWSAGIAMGVLLCASNVKAADTITGTAAPVATTEGVPFSGAVGTFTDSNTNLTVSGFSATINWGDGVSTAGTVSTSNGLLFTVTGTHNYAPDEGNFQVTATLAELADTTVFATVGSTAMVNDGDAFSGTGTMFSANPGTAFSGAVATFTDTNPNILLSDLNVAINWGDGTTSAGTLTLLNGMFTVTGTHTYAAANTYPVSVMLADYAPSTASATVTSTANVGVSSTPEPATFTLLGCGLVVLGRVVRRKASPRS